MEVVYILECNTERGVVPASVELMSNFFMSEYCGGVVSSILGDTVRCHGHIPHGDELSALWVQVPSSQGSMTTHYNHSMQYLDVVTDTWNEVAWPTTIYPTGRAYGVAAVL
jgi:hypothetical protein